MLWRCRQMGKSSHPDSQIDQWALHDTPSNFSHFYGLIFFGWEWEPLSGQFLMVHTRPLHEGFSCFSPKGVFSLWQTQRCGCWGWLWDPSVCSLFTPAASAMFSTWPVRPKGKARCQHQAHHWAESWTAAPRAAQKSWRSIVLKLCLVLWLLLPKLWSMLRL